jgi:hypothetical protein
LIEIPDDHPQKGTCGFVLPLDPLFNSSNMDAPGITAKLLNHPMVQGMARIVPYVMNSGEVIRGSVEDRERMREIERMEMN